MLRPDPAGRQTAAIDPLGNTHSALYDEAGNAIAEIDAMGQCHLLRLRRPRQAGLRQAHP